MSGTRRLGWRVGAGALLLAGATVSAVAACNSDDSSSTPTGSGDNVKVDVDATNQPTETADTGADSPFARVDGGAYNKPDGYDPYGICQKCACPATDYCFGGGGAYTAFSGSCTPSGFGIGCMPLPAGCTGPMDCDCLLKATASDVPCYAVCVQNTRTVYCPNP